MENNKLKAFGFALLLILIDVINIAIIMPFITFIFFYCLDNILTNVDLGVTKASYFYYLLFSFVVYNVFLRREHKTE